MKNRASKCEGTFIVSDYRIKVEQYLKNPLHDSTLNIRTYGGEIREYGLGIEDQPSFSIGDRALLCLSKKNVSITFLVIPMGCRDIRHRTTALPFNLKEINTPINPIAAVIIKLTGNSGITVVPIISILDSSTFGNKVK